MVVAAKVIQFLDTLKDDIEIKHAGVNVASTALTQAMATQAMIAQMHRTLYGDKK
jgi:hypothetical protein